MKNLNCLSGEVVILRLQFPDKLDVNLLRCY